MSDKTLEELSDIAYDHFQAKEFQDAANVLTEAQDRFPQKEGERLVQGEDGSIQIEYLKEVNGVNHTARRSVVAEDVEDEDDDQASE